MNQRATRIRLGAILASFLLPALLFATGWFWIHQASAARNPQPPPPGQIVPGDPIPGQDFLPTPIPMRDVPSLQTDAADISFIDSPTAQCYREAPSSDRCFISWDYLQVSAAAGQYIISMTVSIDNKLRGYSSGFFQTSMFVPSEMYAPGFLVACGLPGAGGNPNLGKTYAYTLQARETGGLSSANYGSVTCPADIVALTNAGLSGPSSGVIGQPYNFQASITPLNASLPITYTWQATDQGTTVVSSNTSSMRSFQWSSPGI